MTGSCVLILGCERECSGRDLYLKKQGVGRSSLTTHLDTLTSVLISLLCFVKLHPGMGLRKVSQATTGMGLRKISQTLSS